VLNEQAKPVPDCGETDADQAAELLRLAIPLMSRYCIPATPPNYAIWYDYIKADNPALNGEIDHLIDKGQPFTAAVNARLYRQFVVEQDIGRIERVRNELHNILREVQQALGEASDNADSFEGTLGGVADAVSTKNDLRDIRQLLETLIESTQSMRCAASGMKSDFDSKSREIEELHEELRRERQRAMTDPLTGLHNRLALVDRLQEAIDQMDAGAPPSVVMLDIDHFKSINDDHGHVIGDRVIRFVARTLLSNIKGRDSAARYGGEEFTLLLPATESKGATAVAEGIRHAVATANLVRADNRKPLGRVTLSAGVATYRPGEDIMTLIHRADQALYRAKSEGRNRVSVA
jgi:diguanylate cyclase